MAWLSSSPVPDPHHTEKGKSWEETVDVMNYWAMRCAPFWKLDNRTFVTCNRVGQEGGEQIHLTLSPFYSPLSCIHHLKLTSGSSFFFLLQFWDAQKPFLPVLLAPFPMLMSLPKTLLNTRQR
jgi:hypothetical protein